MHAEWQLHKRTRGRALLVITAVVAFYLLLLLAMAIWVLMLGTSIAGFIAGILSLGVGWRALTMRTPITHPSRLADLRLYPGLAEALADAALRVGAPLPDGVSLTTAARIYAREEGSLLSLFAARRVLVVGVAALPYLTETEMRALLARALARWSERESWYGVQARRVELAVSLITEHLASAPTRWFNPLYWCFTGFRRLFARMLAGYVRERERWADQLAGVAYTAAEAEEAVKKQALYDAFWAEVLSAEMSHGPTLSFAQVWDHMQGAAAAYPRWRNLWERLLMQPRRPESPEPTLGDRLEAIAGSTTMPAPAQPALSPASRSLLRDP